MDWYAAIVCMLVMIIAPLAAGDFSTPSLLTADTIAEIFAAVGVPLVLLFTALAAVPALYRELKKPVAVGQVTGLASSSAVLLGWSALSAARTPAKNLSLNAMAVLAGAMVIGLIVSRLARDRKAVTSFLLTQMTAGTIVAAVGIREYLQYLAIHIPQHRSFSTFSDPNFLAGYLLMALPLSMAVFATADQSKRRKLFAGISIVMQSACLWLSGSRSGSAMVLIAVTLFTVLALQLRPSAAVKKGVVLAVSLFLIGSLPALTPLMSRLTAKAATPPSPNSGGTRLTVSADAQVNSNEFRRWTWIGTARMAKSNPVFGTGIGAYELTYPRYAETAFTIHAHNSYLQLMSETGYPGAIAMLAILAAASAFAANAYLLARGRPSEADTDPDTSEEVSQSVNSAVLLAGALAALAGSMLHNLIDSDWYVAANVYSLAILLALIVGLARDIAPLSTRRPAPLPSAGISLIALCALVLLLRGAQLTNSRMNLATAKSSIPAAMALQATSQEQAAGQISAARQAYVAAAAADPLDPEPHLGLAEIASADQRVKELQAAIALSPVGKAYYRLGQYYMTEGNYRDAVSAFEMAEMREPKMLQNLRALAGAYLKAGNVSQASETFSKMTHLQTTPYGTVRAMHESVETDFAFAHQGLADIALEHGDRATAMKEYAAAADIFAEYWVGRNYLVNLTGRSQAKRKEIADSYEAVLKALQADPEQAKKRADELAGVQKDRAEDPAIEQKALHPEGF